MGAVELFAQAPRRRFDRAGRLPVARARRPIPRRTAGWVLFAAFAGIPLWWVLGVIEIVFLLTTLPLLVALGRMRRLEVPRGTAVWFLLLIWLLSGVLVLQVDAPGAEPGANMFRYVTFASRYCWYVMATVAMLYVTNATRAMSSHRVSFAISWLFVSLIAGGWLAVLVPTLEFPSAMELLLPRGLTKNEFVASFVHPRVAQLQDFLGYVQARPSAPFYYANQWGVNVAVSLPHFVVSWWARGGRWRIAVPVVLALATVPIVGSLNRTMWGALVAMLVYAAVHLARQGRIRPLLLIVLAFLIGGLVIAASPLGQLIVDRFNNPHSDEGRANLGLMSLQSTWDGSPLVGFGTTRDVAGNFNSIAGGATDACPKCTPPPLGTQGQLWNLVFASGYPALFMYCAFFGLALLRHFTDRSPYSLAAQASIVALFVTLPFYNAVQTALVIGLVSVALMHRERGVRGPDWADLVDPVRRNLGLVVTCALSAMAAGLAVPALLGTPTSSTRVVHVPGDVRLGDEAGVRPLTLDGEARLATSHAVLEAVSSATGVENLVAVRDAIEITARPNSRILRLTYTSTSAGSATRGADALATAFLEQREQLLAEAEEARAMRWQLRQRGLVPDQPALSSEDGGLTPPTDDLRLRYRSLVALETADLIPPGEAQVLRSQDGIRTDDPWVVAAASGLALGTASGLMLCPLVDGRFLRVGRRRGVGIPVVAEVNGTLQGETVGQADAVALTYAPLAGVVADERSTLATAYAARLDRAAGLPNPHLFDRPRRVLIVVEPRSRPREVRRIQAWCARSGLDAVGVVLVDRRWRHRGRS